jgi:hypothetical protein
MSDDELSKKAARSPFLPSRRPLRCGRESKHGSANDEQPRARVSVTVARCISLRSQYTSTRPTTCFGRALTRLYFISRIHIINHGCVQDSVKGCRVRHDSRSWRMGTLYTKVQLRPAVDFRLHLQHDILCSQQPREKPCNSRPMRPQGAAQRDQARVP